MVSLADGFNGTAPYLWVLLEPSAIGLLAGAALLTVYVKTNGRRIKEDMEELDP